MQVKVTYMLPTQYNYLIINKDVGMQVKCAKNIFCLLKVERIGKDTEASYIGDLYGFRLIEQLYEPEEVWVY